MSDARARRAERDGNLYRVLAERIREDDARTLRLLSAASALAYQPAKELVPRPARFPLEEALQLAGAERLQGWLLGVLLRVFELIPEVPQPILETVKGLHEAREEGQSLLEIFRRSQAHEVFVDQGNWAWVHGFAIGLWAPEQALTLPRLAADTAWQIEAGDARIGLYGEVPLEDSRAGKFADDRSWDVAQALKGSIRETLGARLWEIALEFAAGTETETGP